MERNRSIDSQSGSRAPSGAAVIQPRLTDALTHAFFAEWARVGYASISLEKVARQAGVGKAALYRRWPDKIAMASDLLSANATDLTRIDDRGSLRADLEALMLATRTVLRHPAYRAIVSDLTAEAKRSPQLAAAIRPFQEARRRNAAALLDRAIARGELSPRLDRELALDLLAAPLFWRIAVLGQRVSRAQINRMGAMLHAALLADTDG